jgi:hypothetical protein
MTLLAGVLLLAATPAFSFDASPRDLSFEETADASDGNSAWTFIQHAGEESFEFAIDKDVAKQGKKSLRIRRTGNQPFGLASQKIRADRFLGKRVRFSGYVRLENVEPYGTGVLRTFSGAALMLRINGASGTILFLDDMRNRPLRGNSDWKQVSLEADVPLEAATIEFGPVLSGSGTVWFDAATLQEVVRDDREPERPGKER